MTEQKRNTALKTKVCTKCEKEKGLDEFYKDCAARGGRRHQCKKCRAAYDASRYRTEGEQRRRKAYGKRPAVQERQHFAAVKRKYGITRERYEEMLEAQGSVCKFCGKTPEENKQRLSVDHDHTSDRVRWLLCGDCNRGLGLFRDNSAVLRRAADFLDAALDDVEYIKGLANDSS